MFYGAVLPEKYKGSKIDVQRIIAVSEASALLRDAGQTGNGTITFGKWVVKEDINLIALCYHKPYLGRHPLLTELSNKYLQGLQQLSPEARADALEIMEFFASEFAKPKGHSESDNTYLLSATFTEVVVELGYDGVFYPSVRADAEGFNVAILPEVVDSLMRLDAALECTIEKPDHRAVLDNKAFACTDDGGLTFNLEEIKL